MKIYELRSPKGTRTQQKRIGRGVGSGLGKTSGRGSKGQKARTRSQKAFGLEGGQMPLIRRIPKVGFASQGKVDYSIVNLEKLNIFKEETRVTPSLLKQKGLIRKKQQPVKILGKGELKKKLTVSAHAFSTPAKTAIEKAGGTIEVIK